jgi:hypothetical protein
MFSFKQDGFASSKVDIGGSDAKGMASKKLQAASAHLLVTG